MSNEEASYSTASPLVKTTLEKGRAMRIYIFKSESQELHAFAGDSGGSKLPKQHGPWTVTGIITPERAPPHNFSRAAIEEAIEGEGFQLWRLSKKTNVALSESVPQ
jgi:hypothetical protein